MNQNLIYNVSDKPPFGKLIFFALQQLFAVITATITVPAMIGVPTQIPAAILGAGVATIVYLLLTKFKSPVILSSSFAYVNALAGALAYGYLGLILGSIFAGSVYIVFAIIIHFVGTNWISKLFPPIVIGPVISLIGLSLAPNAMKQIVVADGYTGGMNLVAFAIGLITFIVIIVLSVQNHKKSLQLIPFLIGMIVGYILALIVTLIGKACNLPYLAIMDYSPIVENFKNLKFTSFLDYPRVSALLAIEEIANNNVKLTASGVIEIALAFIPVALVSFSECLADHKNLGSIIDSDLIEEEPGLKRILLGDGIGSICGTLLGVCPDTTYGESIGCVALTKNASVSTTFVTAILCIALSFMTPLMKFFQTVPSCVMGGTCLVLYGFIAVSGFKQLAGLDLSISKNLYTMSAILIAGIGGLVLYIPYKFVSNPDGVPVMAKWIEISSIATALLLGIMTYFLIGLVEKHNKKEE